MISPVDAEAAKAACAASKVGKLTRSALYVHKSARNRVPLEVRLLILSAELRLADRQESYKSTNVIKIRRDGSAVSFLWYPDFETDPHPELRRSIHVPIGAGEPSYRYYRHWDPDANPPILHRKEEFLSSDNPLYGKFAALTRAEERAGLLSGTPGFRRPWQERLKKAGYRIWGHRLRRVP